MAERERIARLLYEAWPERGPLMARPWPEMMERKQEPWLAMADALLAAREGACTNTGCVLPDRAGKSYQCNGDARWCTACLRWHYEPLEAQLTTARDRMAEVEHALTANADTQAQRIADLEGGLFGAGRLYGFECPDGLPCWCEPDERKGPHSPRCVELRSLLVNSPDPRPRGR